MTSPTAPAAAESRSPRIPILVAFALIAALAATLLAAGTAQAGKHHKHKRKGATVSVMTRNLYLGADLGPAIASTGPADFVAKNGQILRDVDTNDFPVRSRGLAREIRKKSPDLVGLQEAALWRTGPANLNAPISGDYTASDVKYDYLKELLKRLNHGKKRYRVVKVQKEFDFEAPADYDGNPATGVATLGGEINGRLTMRDALLAKVHAGIKVKRAKAGHYDTLFQPVVSGIAITVERGWVQADVKVRKSRWLRVVDTHLESFGSATQPAGELREAQAKQLIAKGGPMRSRLPAILLGDLNSDDNTVAGPDRLAFDALKAGGLRDRSTEKPMSCCIKSSILTDDHGSTADFDHHIDHVVTNRPKKVRLIRSSVTGRHPSHGYWDSDHAGVFSKLRVLR